MLSLYIDIDYSFRSKLESKSRSIKVLDYAMSGTAGSSICEAFVEALGLKTLFMTFMGKVCLIYLTVFSLFLIVFSHQSDQKNRILKHQHQRICHISSASCPHYYRIWHLNLLAEYGYLRNSWKKSMRKLTN